jgi:hypothetical protein
MRVEPGCFRSKEDAGGGRYYLHRLADGWRPDADLPPRPGAEARQADADTLHRVYSALLAALPLSAAHGDSLRGRGLTDGEVERRGYRSFPVQGRARLARELRERFGDVSWACPASSCASATAAAT